MRRLFVRADMNDVIATGHIMRCLSIADAGRTVGIQTVFILADNQAVDLLTKKGYKCIVLNTRWNNLDDEIEKIVEVIEKEKIEKLLIDSYQVTERYLRELTKLTYTIYLDDLNAFIYPINSIICYTNYWEKFNYHFNYETKFRNGEIAEIPSFLLGGQYVPLRQEFANISNKKVNQEVENLLIMSGGSDPYDAIWQIVSGIKLNDYKRVDIICGRYYSKKEKLLAIYGNMENVHINFNVSNLIEYMVEADVAISAGGSTLYELCAVGTPTISYYYADNQIDNVKKFEVDKIMPCMGDAREGKLGEKINIELQRLRKQKIREEKSKSMKAYVSSDGALNIIKAIMK